MPQEHVAAALSGVAGVHAVALGGSHSRGEAGPQSDYDFGVYYDAAELDLAALDHALTALDDDRRTPACCTRPGAWGRWVNGGAWLTAAACRSTSCSARSGRWSGTIRDWLGRKGDESTFSRAIPSASPTRSTLPRPTTAVRSAAVGGRAVAPAGRPCSDSEGTGYPPRMREATVAGSSGGAAYSLGVRPHGGPQGDSSTPKGRSSGRSAPGCRCCSPQRAAT